MREVIGSISVKYSMRKFIRPFYNQQHFRSSICTWVGKAYVYELA